MELRGLYPDIQYELKEEIINFLNNENELVRAKRAFYQQQLEMNAAMTMLTEHSKDAPTSYYAWDIYVQRRNNLKGELLKASTEMIDSADTFSKSYGKLTEQETKLSGKMNDAGIRFNSIFTKYQESNSKAIMEVKKNAEEMKKFLTAKA